MSKNNYNNGISGKGYYIALILCAIAIGITGYLYYRNADTEPEQLQTPTVEADATIPGDAQEVVATKDAEDVQATSPQLQEAVLGETARPVKGDTVAAYSMEALSYNQTTRDWRVHDGVDIAAEAGAEVCAAADGTVYTVYEDETMGTTVVITHNAGYTTKYSSLDAQVMVEAGQTVAAGQTIGYVGNTALLENAIGDHVHFSVSCNGALVDPEAFLE